MELERIKAAVKAGLTVHWASAGYTVHVDRHDQWLVTWDKGGRRENSVGLIWGSAMDVFRSWDQVTYQQHKLREGKLIEDERSFYVSHKDISYGVNDAGHAWDVAGERKNNGCPTRYVAFDCGAERLWVEVVSYLPDILVDATEAEELASDYLKEINWFANPRKTDAAQVI